MGDMHPVVQQPLIAVVPFDHLKQMAAAIAESGLFGMKTPQQALALMLTAQAEGQHPATITQDYDIIQGRAARKTHSVLARYQQAGGSIEWHELSDKKADATFTPPPGTGKPLRLQWTIEMAKAAELTGKDNWKKYARAMLRSRVIAEGARATYPAAIGGMLIDAEAQDLPAIDTPAANVQPEPIPGPQARATPKVEPEHEKAAIDGAARREPEGAPSEPPTATAGDTEKVLTDGQVRILKARLHHAGLTEADVRAQHGSDLETLRFADFEKIQSWIADKGARVAG